MRWYAAAAASQNPAGSPRSRMAFAERAAMIYQHEARGVDKAITDAIDAYLTDEQLGDDDGNDGVSGVLSTGS
jgi:hypothetical protein